MNEVLVKKDVTIPETINWIRKSVVSGMNHPEVQQITRLCEASEDPLRTLFDTAYNTILYVPDKEGLQSIRTFDNIFRTRRGNCVTYTQLISAVLMNLGIEHYYGVVGYTEPGKYDHIYVQAKGKTLDPVLGQAQDGTDTYLNRPFKGKYNVETKYRFKIRYYMPDLVILQGEKPYSGTRYASRTRRSRMRIGYGVEDSHLGKTIVGKILTGIGDVVHGLANVAVTPIEGILKTQIVGDNYSDTGFGDFVATSQNKNSSLNAVIGNIVTGVFTGGAIKVVDIDKQTLQERAQVVATYDAVQQQKADQQAAQEAFDKLNQQSAANAAEQEAQQKKKKMLLISLAIPAAALTGLMIYKYKFKPSN